MKELTIGSNKSVDSTTTRQWTVRKALLACGIASSLLYIVTLSLGAARWEGYSAASQTISELFAIDAPSRPLVVPLLTVYAILIYAFGIGVWKSAGPVRALRIAGVLIIAKEVFGLIATIITPMHMRGVETNLSDTLHGVFTLIGVFLCMLPAMGFGAAAFGKWFRLYTIVTMLIFVACGVWAFMEVPLITANAATPWVGVRERINAFSYSLWIVVLSIPLFRGQMGPKSVKSESGD